MGGMNNVRETVSKFGRRAPSANALPACSSKQAMLSAAFLTPREESVRRHCRAKRFMLLFLCLCIVVPADAQGTPSPLWGDLKPGSYGVGFRFQWRSDPSRTWQPARRRGQPFRADLEGRPIRIELWYPADSRATAPRMTYRDYIELPSPKGTFQQAGVAIRNRDQLMASLSAPPDKLDALLSTRVAAHAGVTPAAGRFPLLIYFPGLNDSQSLNVFVLAEYLASHGYALATVSSLGHSSLDTDSHRTPVDIEATLRDAEFAWSILRNEPHIDPARLGVMGEASAVLRRYCLPCATATRLPWWDSKAPTASRAQPRC